jgi:hypothetical protein
MEMYTRRELWILSPVSAGLEGFLQVQPELQELLEQADAAEAGAAVVNMLEQVLVLVHSVRVIPAEVAVGATVEPVCVLLLQQRELLMEGRVEMETIMLVEEQAIPAVIREQWGVLLGQMVQEGCLLFSAPER